MEKFPILLLIIIIPLMSAIFLAAFVKQSLNPAKVLYAKYVAVLSSVMTLVCSIFILIDFDHKGGYQYYEIYSLIPSIGLEIELALDGFSVLFVFLTSLLTIIAISISMYSITKHIKEFLICFLLLEAFSIGVFSSVNLLLFYIFFEALLIPMYLVIGIWGGQDRIYASIKFFLYTLFGSVLFLIDIVYLFSQFGTLSMPLLAQHAPHLPLNVQIYLWLAAFIAFAVKVPMFPFHTWLPDAHVQAPTAGSVILAGILLKVGAYGFLRVSINMFTLASIYFSEYVMILSVFAIVYASLVAIAQTDMKKMIAYSSVAHMGYVTAGIFSFTEIGISGAMMQMLSHGIVSSALFIVVGFLYDRLHTKEIAAYGGVAEKMPNLAVFFMIFTFSSIGLPGTSGFVGEFYSIIAMYHVGWCYTFFACFAMVFGAIYMLRLYRNVMLGEIKNSEINAFTDISAREYCCLAPLAFLTIIIGIFPSILSSYYVNDIVSLINKIGHIR